MPSRQAEKVHQGGILSSALPVTVFLVGVPDYHPLRRRARPAGVRNRYLIDRLRMYLSNTRFEFWRSHVLARWVGPRVVLPRFLEHEPIDAYHNCYANHGPKYDACYCTTADIASVYYYLCHCRLRRSACTCRRGCGRVLDAVEEVEESIVEVDSTLSTILK